MPAAIMNGPTAPSPSDTHAGTIGAPAEYRSGSSAGPAPGSVGPTLVARRPAGTLDEPPWSPSSTSAPPSRCSAASRRWPASTSTSSAGEIVLAPGPQRGGQDHAAAGAAPAWCRSPTGDGRSCSATTSGADRRAVRRRVGLLGHATGLYDDLTVADNVRFWARAAGRRPADAEAAMARSGLDGRLRDVAVGPAVGRAAPPGLARRAAWPAGPSCGCSTSPTPASTPTARDVVDDLVARGRGGRRHRGRRLPRARAGRAPSPTAYVTIAGGVVTGPRAGRAELGRRRLDAPAEPSRGAAVFRDARAGRRQGPAHRAALAGQRSTRSRRSRCSCCSCSPSPSTPTAACSTGPRRACSGSPCCSARCSPSSAPSPSRPPTATATRCACRASTRPASSSARRRRSLLQLLALEVVLGVGVVLLYGADGRRLAGCCSSHLRGRDRGDRRRRHPLRRPGRRAPGAGDAAAAAAPARCSPRCSSASTRAFEAACGATGEVGRGSACSPCSPSCTSRRGLRPSAPSWRNRDHRSAPGPTEARPSADARTGPVGTGLGSARGPRPRSPSPASPGGLPGLSWSARRTCSMGDVVRIMYVHVPVATSPTSACFVTTARQRHVPLEAVAVVGPRRRRVGRDRHRVHRAHAGHRLALGPARPGASTGSGTPASPPPLLLFLLLGYLAVRRIAGRPPTRRARRAAIVGLLLLPNVLIVHFSVDWWRTLHQGATI